MSHTSENTLLTSETNKFALNLSSMGVDVTSYDEKSLRYLLNIAKQCFRESGIPVAAMTGAAVAGVGSVTVPVVGAIPGWVAGALAGAFSGTFVCMTGRVSIKPALDEILNKQK